MQLKVSKDKHEKIIVSFLSWGILFHVMKYSLFISDTDLVAFNVFCCSRHKVNQNWRQMSFLVTLYDV